MKTLPFLFASLACAAPSRIQTRIDPLPPESLAATRPDKPPIKPDPFAGMPLKETRVKARIDGIVARVEVYQRFENNNRSAMEANYVFPLPHDAAVNEYSFRMGPREVKGVVQTREKARATYEAARSQGKATALLEQERPNLFSQSIANIPAGQAIEVRIQYDVTLVPDSGRYAFVFPTVVGPRFCPAGRVPDESAISPPVLAPGQPNPHRISLSLDLDAGVPVHGLKSRFHRIATSGTGPVHVELSPDDDVPNKDFRLEYSLGESQPEISLVVDREGEGGHFLLAIQPPAVVDSSQVSAREIVLLLDQSGSMHGQPLAAIQQAARLLVEGLREKDRIQIVSFADMPRRFSDSAVPVTRETRRRALSWIDGLVGGGGTDMMSGIEAAVDAPRHPGTQRLVCLMTDGYIGNEQQIVQAIRDRSGDEVRVHVFGVGSSVNHYLVEEAASAGRGTAFQVNPGQDPSSEIERFRSRLASPLLTGIRFDWGNLPVRDLEPSALPDLYAGQPIFLSGRFTKPAKGDLKIAGRLGGKLVTYTVPVDFSKPDAHHPAVGGLWARSRIGRLTKPWQKGTQEEVTDLALKYHLASPFTSFVAVMDSVVNKDGKSIHVDVPVELPQGVSPLATNRLVNAPGAAAAMPNVQPAGSSSMDLGAGKIDGFLDNPSTVYLLQEDASPFPNMQLERSFVDAIASHVEPCGTLEASVGAFEVVFGDGVRARNDIRIALNGILPRLDSIARRHSLKALSVRLVLAPDGHVSLVRILPGRDPAPGPESFLAKLLSGMAFGAGADKYVVIDVPLAFGSVACKKLPRDGEF